MFYINSDDSTTVPDSLFFLQKIGLLKFQKTEVLAPEDLYFIENGAPQKIYTPDTINSDALLSKTVLIFDFIFGADFSSLLGHNVIVIPHVYFDYVTSIKDLSNLEGLNSFKIYSPETSSTLIPKKHLKITLPFLKDRDFISNTAKMGSSDNKKNPKVSYSRIFILATKSFVSAALDFSFKPFAQLNSLFGHAQVALIKTFYFFYNLRFDIHRAIFNVKQWRYFFYTYNLRFFWGKIKMLFIHCYYWIMHWIRVSSIKSYYAGRQFFRYHLPAFFGRLRLAFIQIMYFFRYLPIRTYDTLVNLRFPILHAFHSIFIFFRYRLIHLLGLLKLAIIKIFYSVINLRFSVIGTLKLLAINSFYSIINLRFAVIGAIKLSAINSYYSVVNSRFALFTLVSKFYTFLRYTTVHYFGVIRVGLIKLFYFFYNLRFPLKHYLSAFYWFNYRYTFYPFRKFCWITEHEFQKRILKISNVSKR